MERRRYSTPRTPFQPPGLSRLSQEVIVDDVDSEMYPIQINEENPLQHNSATIHSPTPIFNYKQPYANMYDDINTPLLASNAPQMVELPSRNTTSDILIGSAPRSRSEIPRGPHGPQSPSINSNFLPQPGAGASARRPNSTAAIAHHSMDLSPASAKTFKAPLLTPAGTDSRFPKSRTEHPFAKGFETPQWHRLAVHLTLCAIGYPFLLLFVSASRGKSLFWARLLIGVGCGLLGGMLGWNLVKMARRILEAAIWATIIHQSRVPDARSAGVRLKDLAVHSDEPTSSIAALRLLWDRYSYPGTERAYRKFYDTRKWSFWVLLFIFNVVISGVLPFIMARLIDVGVNSVQQHETYSEIAVSADLSVEDITRAQNLINAVQDPSLAWTLASLLLQNDVPTAVFFTWGGEFVYFAEITSSQLMDGGAGLGSFETNTTVPSSNADDRDWVETPSTILEPGSIMRFPRWGLRTRCANIPNLSDNLFVSTDNLTYLFTPRNTLKGLFTDFGMDFPSTFEVPINLTNLMNANDTQQLSKGLDQQSIVMGAVFLDDGAGYSTRSTPLNLGDLGTGFVTLETALIRLNTTFAPHGVFPTLSPNPVPDAQGFDTFLGYDAAVCLQLYEPWILEVYNCTIAPPTSMRIVQKAAVVGDLDSNMNGKGQLLETRVGPPLNGVKTRGLNSTGLAPVWTVAHQNALNCYAKDSARSGRYLPTPTLVSFTSSSGPLSYTSLQPSSYAHARSLSDASILLAYLAGSAPSLARRYSDRLLTTTSIHTLGMACLLVGVCLLGLVSGLWVPRLPLEIPHRGTGVFSWVVAFGSGLKAGGGEGELMLEDDLGEEGVGRGGSRKGMELQELREILGEARFRWVAGW